MEVPTYFLTARRCESLESSAKSTYTVGLHEPTPCALEIVSEIYIFFEEWVLTTTWSFETENIKSPSALYLT